MTGTQTLIAGPIIPILRSGAAQVDAVEPKPNSVATHPGPHAGKAAESTDQDRFMMGSCRSKYGAS